MVEWQSVELNWGSYLTIFSVKALLFSEKIVVSSVFVWA